MVDVLFSQSDFKNQRAFLLTAAGHSRVVG